MTTFAQWRSRSSRLERHWTEAKPRPYDIRVVDQFYAHCQAAARLERHRATARARTHRAARRVVNSLLVGGSLLTYYLLERVAQAMTLF